MCALVVGAAACGAHPSATGPTTAAVKEANSLVQAGLRAQDAGRISQALQDYERATKNDPRTTVAYYDIGVVYQRMGSSTPAEQAYTRALAVDPTYKPALFNLAILITPRDPAGAVALYRRLLAINPRDADVNFNLGLLLIGRGQGGEGHQDLRTAIALDASLASRVPAGITP